MMTLGEMREILTRKSIRLTRSLGQNFLHDHHQILRIIEAAHLAPQDQVLEIGPGLGALTQTLVTQVRHVLAIEKDARLLPLLRSRWPDCSNFQLVHADALVELKTHPRSWATWKVVSNLPYSVASPILVELAHQPEPPQRIVATLQLEVAQRLAAGPGHRDYGILTLLVQRLYQPQLAFKIPRTCFFPVPEIDSACLVLERRHEELLPHTMARTFARLVKRAFSERRKMMIKLLKSEWPEPLVRQTLEDLHLPQTVRAEAVSLNQFCLLTRRLAPPPPHPDQPLTPMSPMNEEIFDVVDHSDQVIDRRPRSEVHRLQLKHRAVHVLVHNERGEWFLQKRSMKKDCFPGTWDSSASGHLNVGESYDACALRETREELGLILADVPERLFKIDACPETGQEFVWIYRCQSSGPFTLHPDEIETGGWFTPEYISQWMLDRPHEFAPALRLIWLRLAPNRPTH